MNETRKKIIKLIEPYMDKDLKQFCVIKSHKGLGYFIFLNNFNEIEYVNNLKHFCVEKNKCKIIGHYDITAVEKYITNTINSKISIQLGDLFRNYFSERFSDVEYFMRLPNKALHLYTEQEEKELLELLLKLK